MPFITFLNEKIKGDVSYALELAKAMCEGINLSVGSEEE